MEAEPLLPIARALQQAIDARLLGEGDLPLDVDQAFDDAIKEVAEEIISRRLEAIDPEVVLRLYAERVSDETLKERLGRWAVRKAEDVERSNRREELRRDASRSGSVPLERLDSGTRVRLGMFEPSQIREARKEGSLPPVRTIAFRLVDPVDGVADVISDTVLPLTQAECFEPNQRLRVGVTVAGALEG